MMMALWMTASVASAQGFEKFRDGFAEHKLPLTLNTFPLLAEETNTPFPFQQIPDAVTRMYLGNLTSSPYFAYRVTLPYGYLGLIAYHELSLGCCNNNSYELFVFDAAGNLKDQTLLAHDYNQKDPDSHAETVHDIGTATIDGMGRIVLNEEYWLWSGKQKNQERSASRILVVGKDGRLTEGK